MTSNEQGPAPRPPRPGGGGRPHLALSEQGKAWLTPNPNGSYTAGVHVRLPAGQRKQVTATGPTKSAARRKLQAKVDNLLSTPGGAGVQPTWTVAALGQHWLETKPRQGKRRGDGRLKPQTMWSYTDQVNRIITPAMGSLRVHELTVPVLERALFYLEDSGISTRQSRTVLTMMLALAVRDGALAANPISLVAPPPRDRQEVEALDVSEARRLLTLVDPANRRATTGRKPNSDLLDFVTLGLATGARISEILALRVCDVSLVGPMPLLTISGTLVEPRPGFVEKLTRQESTKTDEVRTLVLPRRGVETLSRRLDRADGLGPTAPLFASRNGTWLWAANLRTRLRAATADDPVLDGTTPHTLRRSVASLVAFEANLDAARMQLGHTLVGSTPLARYVAYHPQAPDLRHILDAFFED